MKMVSSMIKAIKSRGGGLLKGISKQSQMFAEVFALVFIRSYDRAERVNKAMESRGYSGKYIAVTEIPGMRYIEHLFLFVLLILNIYLILFYKPLI
jgi:cobalt/nickel transport system permease protein